MLPLAGCGWVGRTLLAGPKVTIEIPAPPAPVVIQPKRKPLLPWRSEGQIEKASVGGTDSPDGAEHLQCELPGSLHMRNVGGSDGAGLCVFTSMSHTGRYQSDPLFARMQEFMRSRPGGGYPEKVSAMLKAASAQYGLPVPEYVQFEVPVSQIDEAIALLKLAAKNRYLPCITYGRSPTGRYGGRLIYHMVNVPHATDKWFAILDNNYPGEDNYEWIDNVQDFKRAFGATGSCWAIVLITPSPPPHPYTKESK